MSYQVSLLPSVGHMLSGGEQLRSHIRGNIQQQLVGDPLLFLLFTRKVLTTDWLSTIQRWYSVFFPVCSWSWWTPRSTAWSTWPHKWNGGCRRVEGKPSTKSALRITECWRGFQRRIWGHHWRRCISWQRSTSGYQEYFFFFLVE